MPSVTIIVPIYGVEKYIERCAHYLFNQTLQDIEYIFVDDCTKDRSIEVLMTVLNHYPDKKDRCHIIHHETNKGLPSARHTGILQANGDYIAHCDSDDWPELQMYETLYNTAIKGDYDMVSCDSYKANDESTKVRINQKPSSKITQGPIWNKLIKRSIYFENDIEYPTSNKAEDGALMTQLSYYSNRCFHVSEPLYNYYVNPSSICRNDSKEACLKRWKEEMNNTDLRIRFVKRHSLDDSLLLDIYRWKILTRKNLLPLINEKEYLQLWRETYPELNKVYPLNMKISIRRRIAFVLTYIGLYPLFKNILSKYV